MPVKQALPIARIIESRRYLMNPIIRRHQRDLESRIRLWDGRISNYAADMSLRFYEIRLLAHVFLGVWVVLFVVLTVVGAGVRGYVSLFIGMVGFCALQIVGVRCRRVAIHDIAHQYGLSPVSFDGRKLQTPDQFDRLLTRWGMTGDHKGMN